MVLPELAIGGYITEPRAAAAVAEPLDGPSVDLLHPDHRRHGGLVAFGFCERDGAHLFNTVALVGADGPILHYRKLHLFDREPDAFTEGNLGLPVAGTPFGVIGVCICYDLRFVEVLRILSLAGSGHRAGPCGVGRPGSTGRCRTAQPPGHVDSVLAQANLDQVAVVAVSQVADAAPGSPATLGGSVACDAYGELVVGPLLTWGDPTRRSATSTSTPIRAAQVRSPHHPARDGPAPRHLQRRLRRRGSL